MTKEADRKRRQRARNLSGSRVIQVEIRDYETWCKILGEEGYADAAPAGPLPDDKVAGATSRLISCWCRNWLRKQAHEQALKRAQAAFKNPGGQGLLVRDTDPKPDRLVKAKRAESFRPRQDNVEITPLPEPDEDASPGVIDINLDDGFQIITKHDK